MDQLKQLNPESLDSSQSPSTESLDETVKFLGCRVSLRKAAFGTSLFGLLTTISFGVFYSLIGEFLILFPLSALLVEHFTNLLANRLRRPKLYTPFLYSGKFLITMLVTGMLFYIYVRVGDAKRENGGDIYWAFELERTRVLVASALILFALWHRFALRLVKREFEALRYERFVRRTATAIYSFASECESRDDRGKMLASPYAASTIVHSFATAPTLAV